MIRSLLSRSSRKSKFWFNNNSIKMINTSWILQGPKSSGTVSQRSSGEISLPESPQRMNCRHSISNCAAQLAQRSKKTNRIRSNNECTTSPKTSTGDSCAVSLTTLSLQMSCRKGWKTAKKSNSTRHSFESYTTLCGSKSWLRGTVGTTERITAIVLTTNKSMRKINDFWLQIKHLEAILSTQIFQ